MEENMTAQTQREIGKSYFFGGNSDPAKKHYGLMLILEAHKKNDPEAMYIVAKLIFDGVLTTSGADPTEHALRLMCSSANAGCIQARAYLNAFCEKRYADEYGELYKGRSNTGKLVDFEGVPIRISRKGILTPIDAVLEYKDNRNILTLSANLSFLCEDEISNPKAFEQAAMRGIMAWQGEYEVFGGQKMSVRVQLTRESKLWDNLYIIPFTDSISSTVQSFSGVIGTKERKKQIANILEYKRSFANIGLKWSTKSLKFIYILSKDGKFDDYDEIMHVTKHEFGHTIGLGDLYSSEIDSLEGVSKGTYPELDTYAVTDKYYNLVMCDHHGTISNNDIEMVVLAFRENRMQLYQPRKLKGKISAALGKGN